MQSTPSISPDWCDFSVDKSFSINHTLFPIAELIGRASQGLVKDSPTFKNSSISAIHYLTAITCGVG